MKMVQFKIVEITNLDGFLLEFEKVPYYEEREIKSPGYIPPPQKYRNRGEDVRIICRL